MKKGLAIAIASIMLLSTLTALGGVAVAVPGPNAPEIKNLTPAEDTFISPLMSGGGVNVSASYSDPDGINVASVELLIDGESVEFTVNETTVYFATYLDDGYHVATVTVSDNQGNTNSTSWGFIVDSVNPKVSIKSPTFSLFKKVSSTPLVKATLSDNFDVAGFQVLIDAKAVNGVAWVQTGDGAYSISYQVPPGTLRAGFHSIVIMATDLAGNIGYGIAAFRV
jgi:hypothetical protein